MSYPVHITPNKYARQLITELFRIISADLTRLQQILLADSGKFRQHKV